MTFKNLLLLDTRIKDLNEIINSIQQDTSYILIDYFNDTFESILNKINLLNISNSIESVGLVRHGYYLPTYKLIDKQLIPSILQNVEIDDPNIETWNEINLFLSKLKQDYQIKFFDFISCRLDKYPEYHYVFTKLEEITDIKIGASNDDIGNLGGDWILEDGNRNLLDIYFTENILNYQYLFFTPVVTIKPNTVTKYYDGIYFNSPTITYVGFIDNDTYLSLSGSISYSGTYLTALNTGTYTIIASGLSSEKYYLDYQIGNLFILKATLNISINNYIKIYNGQSDMPDYIVNYSGFIPGEDYTDLLGSLTLSGSFLSAINVGVYTIIPSGYYSPNYNIIYKSSTLTIQPAILLIIANNVTKIYDRVPYYGGDGVIYDGFMDNDTPLDLQGTLTYTGDSQGAYDVGTYTIMPSGLSSLNYSIMFISGTLIIYTDLFLIKANDFAKFYDNLFFSNPTISYTGDINDLSGSIVYSGSYQYGLNTGTYTIYSNGLYSANYDLTYYGGTLTIDKNEVYIIANNVTKIYDAVPYSDIVVTIEGLQGTDTSNVFQGSLLNLGSSYGIVNIGTYNIIPFNLYSNNYSILYKQGTLIINPAPLYINTRSFTKMYDGTSDIDNDIMQSNIIYSISGIINNEIITLMSYSVRYKSHIAGQHFIDISNITLSGFTLNNYYIVPVAPVPGIILQRPVNAKFTGGNKTYDGTKNVFGLLYSLSGILGLEEVSISSYLALYRSERAGPQIIDISFVTLYGVTAPNYYVTQMFPFMGLIYQNFLKIYFYGGDKTYDTYTVPGPMTYLIEGVSEGDVITISSYIAIFRTPNVGRQIIDVSSIILDGPMAYTYTPPKMISFYSNINPIYLKLKYFGGNKQYDATHGVPPLTYTLSGMMGYDIITISSYIARYKNSYTGLQYLDISYSILFGPTAQNYLYYPVEPIQATISKRGVYAKFFSTGKIYDGRTIVENIIGTVSGTVEREYIYTTTLSGGFMVPYYPVIELGNYDISAYKINLTDYSGNIWYIYTHGITSNLYFDLSGIIRADPLNLFNYKVTDILGPNSIYYQIDLSLNVIKYKYPYLDPSSNIIDPTAKWIWSDSSYNIQQYQALYKNTTNDFQYGTIYSNINANVDIYMNGYYLGNTNNVYTTFKYPILIYPGTNTFVFVATVTNKNPGLLISIIDNITNNVIINSNKFIWSYCINRPIITYQYYSYLSYMEKVNVLYFESIFRNSNAGLGIIDISNVFLQGEQLDINVFDNYYLLPVEPINAPIQKRKLIVKFFGGNKKYDGTRFTTPLTYSLSGMINESINNVFLNYFQSLTISSYVSLFKSPNVGFNLIDISSVILSGFYADNYFIESVQSITGYIDYATLIASFKGGNKKYDGTRLTGPITFSLSGMLYYDQITISSYIALFKKPNVGYQLIDVSNIILFGDNINSYKIVNVPPFSSYIDFVTLNVSFFGGNKIYDGNNIPGPILYTISGLIGFDYFDFLTFNSLFRNTNIGFNIIDVSNVVGYGPFSNNYLFAPVLPFMSFINPRSLTIRFNGGSKIYDSFRNAGSTIVGSINNIVTGEIVTISSFIAMFKDPNAGQKFIDISNVILNGPTAFNYEILPIVSISGIIYRKDITATFNGGNKIYDNTRLTGPLFYSLSGMVVNENITISSYIALFKSKVVGNRFIDISSIILFGLTVDNYTLNGVPALASFIDNRNIIASFTGGVKRYDSLFTTGPISNTLSGIIGNDYVEITSFDSRFKRNIVGSNAIDISNIILSGTDAINYVILPVGPFSSFILPRQINVLFGGGSKIYDSFRNAGLTIFGIPTNIVSGEIITISSFIAMFKDSNAGQKFIDISNVILNGPTAFNYEILPIVSISGIIYRKDLTATFNGGNKIYDNTRLTGPLFYSLSGMVVNENITISSYIALFKSKVVGNRFIDISNIILFGVTVNNYNLNPVPALASFIDYRNIIALFTDGVKRYDSLFTTGPISNTLSGIIGNDYVEITSFDSRFKRNIVGSNAIDISNIILSGTDAINYVILPVGPFNSFILPRQINVLFGSGSKIYDSFRNAGSTIFGIPTNIVSGEIITISSFIAIFRDPDVGQKFIDISNVILNGPTAFNYEILPIVSISGIIDPRGLICSFTGGSKTYDKLYTTGTVIGSISGMVANENVFIQSFTSQYQDNRAGNRLIDISNIILGGFKPFNYFVIGVRPIIGFISQREIFTIFQNGNKEYDGTTIPFYTFNGYITNNVIGDNVFINSNYVARFRSPNAGPQFIDISNVSLIGIDAENYFVSTVLPVDGYIYAKNISINFSGGNKIYNGIRNPGESFSYLIIGSIPQDNITLLSYNALFRSSNVGPQFIDISNVLISGIPSNYIINPINSVDSYIFLKNIYVIFSGGDKFYDKTLIPGLSLTGTISGIVNNENIILSSFTSSFNNFNVGLRRIDISNVVLTGSTISNYSLQTILPINANIFKRPGTVFFTGGDKIYDGNRVPSTININVNNKIPGDDINVNYIIANFINKNVGLVPIIIEGVVIGGNDVNNYEYTIITTLSSYIYPKNISIIFRGGNKFYDKTLNTGSISGSFVGIISGDDVNISSFNSRYRNFNVGVQIIDISNVTLGGINSTNYITNSILPINGNIYPSQLNAFFTISDKMYDTTNIPYGINYILYPVYTNDNVILSSYNAFYVNRNIGYRRIDISNAILGGINSNNYRLNNIPSTYSNILPNQLTVTFSGGNKVYDRTNSVPILNYVITGIINNEYLQVDSYVARYRNINSGIQIIDISNVIVSGPTINNYTVLPILPINGIISQKPLTLTFTNLSKTYDGNNLVTNTISAALNGIVSGDQVIIQSFSGLYRTILAGNTILDISNVIIIGSSSNNYNVIPVSGLSTQILRRLLIIIFSGGDKNYDGLLTTGPIYNQISNIVSNESISIVSFTSRYKSPNIGYQLIDISNVTISGLTINNYFINPIAPITGYIYGQAISVSFTGVNKIYDNTIIAYVTNPIISGLTGNDNLIVTISSYFSYYSNKFVENNKTIYVTNILLKGTNSINYFVSPSTLTTFSNIIPKQLYLISDAITREYDQTTNVLLSNVYLSGIFEEDKIYVSISSYIAQYNDINAQINKQINITNILLNGPYSYNYFINSTVTVGTILRKTVPVYFGINNKNFDGLTNASINSISISNIIYPDITFITSYKSNFIDSNVGFNKLVIISDISFGGSSGINYRTNTYYGSATITYPTSLSISLTSNSILYKDISNYMLININPVWQYIPNNINNNLVGIYKNIIISDNGTIYDNSNNILNSYYTSNSIFTNLTMTDDQNGFICGNNGLILSTTNAFRNVSVLNYGSNTFNSISKINSFIGFVVGDNGTIYKTSNAGLTWNQITSGTTNKLNDVSLVDNNIIYIVGSNGTLLRTINSGSTWTRRTIESVNLNSIVMIDQFNGFIVGNNGLILKTNDSNNWVETLNDFGQKFTNNNLNHIYSLSIDDIVIVGDNGTILRSTNRGISWIIYTSGTLINLNRVYMYTGNNIIVIGDNGVVLKFLLNPEGYIDINDSNILLSRINIPENNPLYYYYLNTLTVKNYNLSVIFTPNNLNSYGIGYSNTVTLNVRPIIFYQINTTDTLFERNNIINSILPFTDQSGGVFTILDNIGNAVQQNKVTINSISGIITFQTGINVNYYLFTIIYTINNSSNQTTYSLFIRPNFYYLINLSSLIINNSGSSIVPYFNQKNGIFTISDISGSLVRNGLVSINSLSGIILFNNNIAINNYSFNVSYTLNSVSSYFIYYLNVRPFINYVPNIINLEYNTSNVTNLPIVNNTGGTFMIYDISTNLVATNKVSINNLGAISISSGIDVGLYNFTIIYTFNGVSNSTIYTINASPFVQYPEIYRVIPFEHTIYDGSSIPIYFPTGGIFSSIDISGSLISQNLVNINPINGQLIFGNINVNSYMFNINYMYNNGYKITTYTLQVKPMVYYVPDKTTIFFNVSASSVLPYINPNNGTFNIVGNNNLLVQLNLVRINFLTGLINFLTNINPGIYNFNINYTVNNITSITNYFLEVIPNLNYSNNTRILLYGISGFSVNPTYSPDGGIFSLSGIFNNLITINSNNGSIFFNRLIDVGRYNFNVIYFINNVFTFNSYQLIILPVINYSINSDTLQYQRSIENYSTRPFVNQPNGSFIIYDFSNNQPILVPNFVSIDISGIITFSRRIDVGIYNFGINYTLNNFTNFTTYNLIIKPEFNYPIGTANLLFDRPTIFNTEEPFVDQSGGRFNIITSTNFANISISSGIISLNTLISVNTYVLTIRYLLRNSFTTTTYNINVIPNIYYTISSIITNYFTSSTSTNPYYSPLGGVFTINDISGSNLVLNNLVTITQVGILSFNRNINVGIYNTLVTYRINNIINQARFNYIVIPNLTYTSTITTLLFDQSGNSVNPIFSQANGIFTIYDISNTNIANSVVLINPFTGNISFRAGINVGIYYLNAVYSLNNTSNNVIHQLNILPKLSYSDNNRTILFERINPSFSSLPYYFQLGGYFVITDNFGNLVNNNQVSINTISGFITFNTNINVGIYRFNVIYNLNRVSNLFIYNLNVIPNLEYTPNTTTLNFNVPGTSNIPYYNQINGSFGIADVVGNLVRTNIVTINSNNGVINFPRAINVGLYSFLITYSLNGINNTFMYYLNIIPNINYSIGFKNLNYGNDSLSVLPIVNQTRGVFSLLDFSGNAVAQNAVFINTTTGIITFTDYINVGIYILNVQYTLNNSSNFFRYFLNVYPTITYTPNSITLLFNRIFIVTSVFPQINQPGGSFIFFDTSGSSLIASNMVYADSSGALYFANNIFVGNYRFDILYTLNGLSVMTSYNLSIIPNIEYSYIVNTLLFGEAFNSGIPYYDQSGGRFSFVDISGYLVSRNIITYDISNGLFFFRTRPDVGIYNLKITYTLNIAFNYQNIVFYILPIINYNISSVRYIYNSNNYSILPFVNQPSGRFSITEINSANLPNIDGIFIDTSNGIINFTNSIGVDRYTLTINYFLNLVSNTTKYYLLIYPVCDYNFPFLVATYDGVGQSQTAIYDPPGGLFTIAPNPTDISSYSSTLAYINNGYINVNPNNGLLTFDIQIQVAIYKLIVTYTFNNISSSVNFLFTKQPSTSYDPTYQVIKYRDISFSLMPLVAPSGGTFNATVPLINLIYTGISINRNTGVLRFGAVNAGFWNISVNYVVNGVTKTIIYRLEVQAGVYYTPPYSVIPFNTFAFTSPPTTEIPNGQFTSTSTITGFSIDSTTGVLTFNNIVTGVYYIPIIYTIFSVDVIINYTLVVKPTVIYDPDTITTFFTYPVNSVKPRASPPGGEFSATFNDDNLTPLINTIYIDTISGIIYTLPGLRVGLYNILVNYTANGSIELKPYTITVYPIFNYPIGFKSVIYEDVTYSEVPFINPRLGLFSTNTSFFVDPSSGIILFKPTTSVGQYVIPIIYTYNSLSVTQNYNLTVKPIYYYIRNYIEVIINNGGQSELPYAKQELGIFSYVSVSGTLPIPYGVSFLSSGDQYIKNGIILNGYTGILNFGDRILVGSYVLTLAYTLFNLSTSTQFTFIVRPYINYELSNLILDYNTSATSSVPFVDQSGGFFYFSNIGDLNTEFNKIIINNRTGVINFNSGIKVGKFKINITYIVSQISNVTTFNLTIRPIFYYFNPVTTIIFGQSGNSNNPTVIQVGGIFELIDFNDLSIDNVYINMFTGIMYFTSISIGSYQFIIKYTLNNSSITTTYKLIVIPGFSYDINAITLFYSRSGYSIIPYVPFTGGLFGFTDITSFDFLYTKVFIDASNGQLYFAKYINTGTYDIKLFYFYNNIYNYSTYQLTILPLIEYTISGIVLDYNHPLYSTIQPTVNPTKGLFFFADFSNNYPVTDLTMNKNTGSITVGKINVGNYFIGIKYYLKEFCSAERFIITILPSFYYSPTFSITYSIIDFTYSDIPFIDPSGGIFNFVYPLHNNLLNKININNNNGQILFYNSIDVSSYSFNVSYNYNNNINFAKFTLIVKPLFIYDETSLAILNTNTGTSSVPLTYPNGGTFKIESITLPNNIIYRSISGITIDINMGVINIDDYVPIGEYTLNISYEYTLLYSYFTYIIQILPNLSYPVSEKTISYGYLQFSEKPSIDAQNGIYFIDSIYNSNGIFIDQSSGILKFSPYTYVNYYPITVYYSLYTIQQETTYNLLVVPDLYYDSSNIIISYGETFYTRKPFINPKSGTFSTDFGIIDSSGVINLSNLSVSSYVINITYLYNYITNVFNINLLVKPYLLYRTKFQYVIYCVQKYSDYPIISPPNGIFYVDSSNINIDSNGIIIFNTTQNIGKYNLNIYYKVDNITNTSNYQYYIIPFINYLDNGYQIRGGLSGKTNIPIVNPINGLFNINYFNGITIDNSGSLIINSNTKIGTYNINVNYSFGDLSNNFIYNLSVTPFVYYNNKIINYQTSSSSEIPIKNSSIGTFSIEFDINSQIRIESVSIDISSGLINFDSLLDIGSYFFYVIYTVNSLRYAHTYYLDVIPNIKYSNVNFNHLSPFSLSPSIINPIGGLFYSSNLPYFISLNSNNGLINIDQNNIVGKYMLTISYVINNVSNGYQISVNIIPIINYPTNQIIIYGDIGFLSQPIVSISGGTYISYELPTGLLINSQTGILNYSNYIAVKQYYIKVFYYINDVSGSTIFNLLVKPYLNYITGSTIEYGQNGSSVLPNTNPQGGVFSFTNSYSNISINSVYGIVTFNNNIYVGSYTIPILYTFNDISNIYLFNLSITQKVIYANFIVNNKIYDGTNDVIFNDNKLIGVINDDRAFINSYNGSFQTVGPGYNIPILINNLTLGGLDAYNYILQYDNLATGNIYLVKYDPDYFKINRGNAGNSDPPMISPLLTNPLFILNTVTTSSFIDISNTLINYFRVNPYGVIIWNNLLPIGIYYVNIKAYNSTLNYNTIYTLEVTTNLFEGDIYIEPPIIPNVNIVSSVYQEQYNATSGNAYILNDQISGLVGKFSITAYNTNNDNISHDLGQSFPFTFKLENADPSATLFTYELNDDGTINYSVPYPLTYIGGGYWRTYLKYLSDFYVQDITALVNEPPIIAPPSDVYYVDSVLEVLIIALPNSIIYYTIDGSNPTTDSLIYSGSIKLSQSATVKAFASTPGYANSQISSATYVVNVVVCILSKTFIRTPMGDQYIDNLKDGDLIITSDGRIVPIIRIIKYYIENPSEISYPVCIPKDYFGKNMPDKNTYVSQNHAIKLFNNKWIYGGNHLHYFSLYKVKPLYFHILLPNYYTDDLIANNIIVESWSGFLLKNTNVKYIRDGKFIHNNKEYFTHKKVILQFNKKYLI